MEHATRPTTKPGEVGVVRAPTRVPRVYIGLTALARTFLVLVIASADAEQPAYSQTDCSNPPIPWADVQKQFWEAGYAIVTPCAFAGESELLNAVHDYALTGCKWAQAVRAGRNYPAKPGTCPRKSNKWKSVAAIHDAAVSEETRRMLAYLHDTQELPFPYQTVTRVHPAIIRAHSDVIFWDTFPRAHTAGSWLALEDIHPDSGPLEIYPKSHRESLWDEYELGLPTAAEAIKAAIAASSPPPRRTIGLVEDTEPANGADSCPHAHTPLFRCQI